MKSTLFPIQKLFLVAFFLHLTHFSFSQFLQVTGGNTPPFTPQNLISNVFLGDGVEVTNITFNGNPVAVGYFTGGTQSIGIERGIVMTSGRAESQGALLGSNENGSDFASVDNGSSASDINLLSLTTAGIQNVAVYTITFIPTSDTLRFKYCFGSEEYPEYACSPYNDVFGFFIQGPGYPSFTNIAKIPGTNLPVTINNLHPANPIYNCSALNDQFYNSNNGSSVQPSYDGFTDVFIAEAIVTPCQQYTIKLAIADVSDQIYDSGVFLEAKSFGTGSLDIELATLSADGAIVEGCATGTLTFKLPTPATEDIILDYNVWGTATNGVDYQAIPPGLIIQTGQTEVVIPIVGFEDNTVEGPEFIAVDIQRDPCNRDTVYIYIKDNALIAPILRPDTTICLGASALELNGTLPITLPPPPSFTNTQDYTLNFLTGPVQSPINVFGVQPTVLGPDMIQSVCFNINHNWDDDVDVFLISPSGQFMELTTDNGSNGDNYINTCFSPTANNVISFPGPFAPASAAPFTGTWAPEGTWSDLWDGAYPSNGTWRLQVRDDAQGFNGTLTDWTITFEPSYKINYQWSPIANVSCPNCPITNVNPTQTTTYNIVATDSYGCSVTDSVTIAVLDALEAPVVSCAATTNNSISFTWTPVVNAVSYEVNINGGGWGPASGLTTHDVTGLLPNSSITIQVRAVNAAFFCGGQIGTTTCVNCQQPQLQANVQDISCFGQSNGTVTVQTDNLNPPYNFQLGTAQNATGIFNNLAANTFTLVVTDMSGCSNSQQIVINTPAQIIANTVVQQQVSCFGGNNGSISSTATGGTGAFTYLWSAGAQTNPTAANLPIGIYTVTVTDSNGCSKTASATITQPTDLALTAQATAANCFGSATGSASASGNGGTQPYQFVWSNAVNNAVNPNLPAGNYTITITDANGCAETSFVTVGQPSALTTTANTIQVACAGDSNGSATVTPNGGTAPYSYLWNTTPPQSTQNAVNLSAQLYIVTVTDAKGCTIIQPAVIGSPQPITLSQTTATVSCFGGNNGAASVIAEGGTNPYSYTWNDPLAQTNANAVNLSAGAYTVTVSDANGCTKTSNAIISQPSILQLSGNPTAATCFGKNDGKIISNAQGGTLPYVYSWSSGETTPHLSNKGAGTYTLTLTDAEGCTATMSQTIGQPTQIQNNISVDDVKCFGLSTGGIQLNVSGGSPTYSINWTGPNLFIGAGAQLQNLFAGNYQATITDNAGCTQTLNTNIQQPAAVLSLVLPTFADTICFMANNGTATVQVSGGTSPYNYFWNVGGQITPTAVGLVSAAYEVTVTDANGCTGSASTFVLQKEQLNAAAIATDPNCHDGKDGKARVTVVYYGATPANPADFLYAWNTTPVQASQEANGLQALQTYTVTLSDAQGCTAETNVTLGNPEPTFVNISGSGDVLCFGSATGWASAIGTGGVGPYTYFWSPGGTSQTDSLVQGLPAGTFKVTATDAKGCQDVTAVTISQPTALRAVVTPTDVLCFGGTDGAARVQGSGGVLPYQFQWPGGQAGLEVQNLSSGPITVTITDGNGCTSVGTGNIGEPANPLSGAVLIEDVSCFGLRDGKITILAEGGSGPYQYALDNNPLGGASIIIGLLSGTYVPKIVDKNGCTVELPPATVGTPDALEVNLGPDITLLFGQDTQLVALVTNAQGLVNYAWGLQDSAYLSCLTCANPLVEGLETFRWFEVQVTDENGCTAEDQIRIGIEKIKRIFVPTGFSPNGDQENDLLLVHGRQNAKVLDFRVYDRWGELIYQGGNFEVNDSNAGWDGQFRGKEMDPGVYVWVLEVQYDDGEKEVFKGNTTLIR